MHKPEPLISVITVCYQSAGTLAGTLESLRAQTVKRFESIVVDGGSTDGTQKLVADFDDVVDQFVSEPDKGIYDAMNKGVALARAPYIAFLNSDDAYPMHTIETWVNAIECSGKDAYYGNMTKVRYWGGERFTRLEKPNIELMPKTMGIFHPSTCVAKKWFETLGGFDLKYRLAADYDWLLGLYLAKAEFEYVDESLSIFSVDGVSNTSCDSYREAADIQRRRGLEHYKEMEGLFELCKKKQTKQRIIAKFAKLPFFKSIYRQKLKKNWN